MPRRKCQICEHPERARAELLLAKGDGFAQTARRLSMDKDSLERHWKRHVPELHREALKPGAAALAMRADLAAQIAEESTSTLEHMQAARALLWQMLIEQRVKGQAGVASMVAAQFTKVCTLIAKITGELATSPLVTHNNLTVNFTQVPEFQQLMDDVALALEPYPEARRAVFERFAALEAPDSRVIDVPALPQVEHANIPEA